MDGITPDMSAASPDIASPSEAATSAVASEAVGAEQTLPVDTQNAVSSGDSSTPQPEIEFPDDAALQQMPATERQSNWQQLRTAYASAKSDAQAYAQYKDAIAHIEQVGGFERLQQQAELGSLLFSTIENPETGQAELTADPFIERLVSDSPGTLGEIVWKGLNQPSPWNPDETIAHTWFRDHLGLKPELLDTYRQIQTPQDAQKYLAQTNAPTAEELAAIPQHFQDAYKSLSPGQREEFSYMTPERQQEFLQDKADALKAREYIAQQEAAQAEARRQQEQQFQQRVEQRGAELAQSVQSALMESAKQKLQAEARFSPDDNINGALHQESITWAAQKVLSDPALQRDSQRAEELYGLSARYELAGDRFKAQEFKMQADNLARKLEGRFRTALNERVAFWSTAFGQARSAQQQQIQAARPRPEIGANNATTSSAQQRPAGNAQQGFGFTPQQIAQYAAEIRARQMGS